MLSSPLSRFAACVVFRTSAAVLLLSVLASSVEAQEPAAAAEPDEKVIKPAETPAKAPEKYRVKMTTSRGDIVIEVNRAWAPKGADRFYEIATNGFLEKCRFFRVVPGFVVQFGINGNPATQRNWRTASIPDDPVVASNLRGYLTFATSGPNSRTTQLFINLKDNERLDSMGFAPFAKVVSGMDVVDAITAEYGERPDQGQIQFRGNDYLQSEFPNLDYISAVTVVKDTE